MKPEILAHRILELLREGPLHFEDILFKFKQEPYRVVLQAWGHLREAGSLGREVETGRYVAGPNVGKFGETPGGSGENN